MFWRSPNFFLKTGWWIGVLLWGSPALAEGLSATPEEVMRLWLQTYPDHLEVAVTLTTPRMRQFLTPSQWIAVEERRRKRTAVRHIHRIIVAERSSGDRSVFTVLAHISTEQGEDQRWEYYTVRSFCTTWLIDRLHIAHDDSTPNP
ncbi:MAG: hypothetical protein D6690_02920 [Nitrospirae bacterium]|nr:MAG: hypothetical protein D6690_02920 [Nitrospirota bacterium]